jgi:hypothetical protein
VKFVILKLVALKKQHLVVMTMLVPLTVVTLILDAPILILCVMTTILALKMNATNKPDVTTHPLFVLLSTLVMKVLAILLKDVVTQQLTVMIVMLVLMIPVTLVKMKYVNIHQFVVTMITPAQQILVFLPMDV